MGGALAFNLLVNAALSFAGALAIVALVLRLFRVGPDRFQLAFLALPWLKVFWDAAHGIPEQSFFWQRLHGARQELGSFQIGMGANHWGPLLELRLGARLHGRAYPQSAAELLESGLSRLWPGLPSALALATLSISSALVLRRVWGWLEHARGRRQSRAAVVLVRRVGFRTVTVLADDTYWGGPYAEGLWAPRVIFSSQHLARLSSAEQNACLLHELAHVAHGDTLWSPLLQLLTDACWFLPGARWVLGRFRSVMELRADACAVRAGASAAGLAAALITTGELLQRSGAPGVGLTRKRLLTRRVQRLLDPAAEKPARAGFQRARLRLALSAVIALCVLQATFFGNQPFH